MQRCWPVLLMSRIISGFKLKPWRGGPKSLCKECLSRGWKRKAVKGCSVIYKLILNPITDPPTQIEITSRVSILVGVCRSVGDKYSDSSFSGPIFQIIKKYARWGTAAWAIIKQDELLRLELLGSGCFPRWKEHRHKKLHDSSPNIFFFPEKKVMLCDAAGSKNCPKEILISLN